MITPILYTASSKIRVFIPHFKQFSFKITSNISINFNQYKISL